MYKELLRNQVTDTQFQIECLSAELVEMLMRRYGWDMNKALDELYSSEIVCHFLSCNELSDDWDSDGRNMDITT